MLQQNDHVQHTRFGMGHAIAVDNETAIVQFEHGIERCRLAELEKIDSPQDASRRANWDQPLEVVCRVQAEAIQSVNDAWGVLSKSRIVLLPHQLWVCRQVLQSWPARWLVADDVGLGKTIEAGLILWPLLSRESVKRLLIICPSSLVAQWQARLRTMFDIRIATYVPESDTEASDFWHTHPQVVASMHTLRQGEKGQKGKRTTNGRHERMLEAPPWDLVLVDEAHHLNADEQGGPTLGYRLVEKLVEANQIKSMVFFSGTPHRGKNYGFLALLKLLRPDLFDPKRPLDEQLPHLQQVMVRNNKQNVTDLNGNRLFKAPKVTSETYQYGDDEDRFYSMLTEFIATGKAYASTLESNDQRTAILVLIAMQKLASSSVAAIRRALKNRLSRIQSTRDDITKLEKRKDVLQAYEELEQNFDMDELNKIDESLAEKTAALQLMEDEEPRLIELIESADAVRIETKIRTILELIVDRFIGRSILFFTEYKATQALLMSSLIAEYGDGCVTFINGDRKAEGVINAKGEAVSLSEERDTAAAKFNDGRVRFLVSTEAAGEGIDLQENAYTLIHVDLPWNPMRLHQRVGRLNRYGQKQRVEVMTLRNPSTVESRIWEKLNEKIDNIMQSLGEVMDEPEDLLELVLGMASPSMFREVFSGANAADPLSLGNWFDSKTATFGGQDVIDTVRGLVGHCANFDFQSMSDKIPKIDVPALQPFFLSMLRVNRRDFTEDEQGVSFKTPEAWMNTPAVRSKYTDVVLQRDADKSIPSERVLGIGHVLIDEAIRQARLFKGSVCGITDKVLKNPIIVYRIVDKVTSNTSNVRSTVVGTIIDTENEKPILLRDWELVLALNRILSRRTLARDPAIACPVTTESVDELKRLGQEIVQTSLHDLDLPFSVPEIHLLAILCPVSIDSATND